MVTTKCIAVVKIINLSKARYKYILVTLLEIHQEIENKILFVQQVQLPDIRDLKPTYSEIMH